jgi:hypothetical protein
VTDDVAVRWPWTKSTSNNSAVEKNSADFIFSPPRTVLLWSDRLRVRGRKKVRERELWRFIELNKPRAKHGWKPRSTFSASPVGKPAMPCRVIAWVFLCFLFATALTSSGVNWRQNRLSDFRCHLCLIVGRFGLKSNAKTAPTTTTVTTTDERERPRHKEDWFLFCKALVRSDCFAGGVVRPSGFSFPPVSRSHRCYFTRLAGRQRSRSVSRNMGWPPWSPTLRRRTDPSCPPNAANNDQKMVHHSSFPHVSQRNCCRSAFTTIEALVLL